MTEDAWLNRLADQAEAGGREGAVSMEEMRAAFDAPEYECPHCCRWASWTDGTVAADGDDRDEFWCQTCGHETPLDACRTRRGGQE